MQHSLLCLILTILSTLSSTSYAIKAEQQTVKPLSSATAYFAGGCFWCMEADFEKLGGVKEVVSGFTGGTLKNPSYEGDHTGHYEAVAITYDPKKITYAELLKHFWHSIDPFDARGQFCDKGHSYKSALFVSNKDERLLAKQSFDNTQQIFPNQTISTVTLPFTKFYPVKESHQNYYKKNPLRYHYYRHSCGRDKQLERIWGKKEK